MREKLSFPVTLILMLLILSIWVTADDNRNKPFAVSPGSETGLMVVWQNCPTFSWSAVDQAASYRIAVFESFDPEVVEYEKMTSSLSPVINKTIPGPALSWTLSSDSSLKTGSMYSWYVQAVDAFGNAIGPWSDGQLFIVEQETHFAGIEEKIAEKLREYGVDEETISNVVKDVKSEVKEVVVRKGSSSKQIPDISGEMGTEGTYNTFYGNQAGKQNPTSAVYLTAVGASAGYNNTNSGVNNTFIGGFAGYATDTGDDNTFVGVNCGHDNDEGNNNTFMGYNAGYLNTGGSSNTFIGKLSGYTNTTASNNSFFGYYSGKNTSTGAENTFLGAYAGELNTTGSYNVFMGRHSGNSNTTGSNNSYLGYYAGYASNSGYENVAVGRQAGYSNNTGYGNVFLGNKAGYSETGSNKLYIANSETTTPLIWGDFANNILTVNGQLGIGTTSPVGTFEIEKTGANAVFIFERTDGATGKFTARPNEIYMGTGSEHNVAIVANNNVIMTLTPGGNVGIGTTSPSYPLHMSSGAYCSSGGTWTDASSRSLKENILDISSGEAAEALSKLNPVKYNYIVDSSDQHLGFIAEDVPDLVASKDRKGMSPMDVVAVLTKVVQEQQKTIDELKKRIDGLENKK